MKTTTFFEQTNTLLSRAEMGRLHGGAGNCAVASEMHTSDGTETIYTCGHTEAEARSTGGSYCCGACASAHC